MAFLPPIIVQGVEKLTGLKIVVTSPETELAAREYLANVRKAVKELKANVSELKKPFKKEIDEIDNLSKPLLVRLQQRDDETERAILAYLRRVKEEAEKANQKALKKFEKKASLAEAKAIAQGKPMPLIVPPAMVSPPPKTVELDGAKQTTMKIRKWRIDLGFDAGLSRFTAWSQALWQQRGVAGAHLFHKVMPIQGPPEGLVSSEMEQGGFGAVILGRNHLELGRERFLYRQRAKAVSLIGTHPRWSEVLVPLDLGLVSLFVLRHLMQSLMGHPQFRLDFLHVLQGYESAARKRWREMHTILGWESPVQLRLVPRTGEVAATILGELKNGEFGTIVMGKRGLSRIKHLLLGSVSSAVLQGLTNQSLLLID